MEKASNGLYVLSASPSMIKPFIKMSLKSVNIPYKKVFTRGFFAREDKHDYKIEKIENVINKNGTDQVILLGDNIESDHAIYAEVEDRNPGKIAQIYIHRILDTIDERGIRYYYTAFEVAAHEFLAGRMTLAKVTEVANLIISVSNKKFFKVITNYSYCPESSDDFTPIDSEKLKLINQAVQTKILQYCKNRSVD